MVLPPVTTTIEGTQGQQLRQFKSGELLAFAVDSDTDVDAGVIDNRGTTSSILQIINRHASNGLTYTVYGTAINTVPATFNAEEWEEIVAATAVAIDAQNIDVITTQYSWILVRVRRTVASNDSTMELHYKGKA